MAGAKLRREHRIHRKRQEAGRGGNPALLHDDSAVVQRRAGTEDGDQQIIGKVGVQRHPAFDEGAQTDLAFNDDKRAGDRLGKMVGREHDVFVAVGAVKDAAAPRRKHAPQPRQGMPDFRAEDDDQREDRVGQNVGDDPVNGLELFQVRNPESCDQDDYRDQHGNRARALDELEELVDDKRHHQNVDDGEHRHMRHVAEGLKHPGSLSGEIAAPFYSF